MVATPWPPPTQALTHPYRPSLTFNIRARVPVKRIRWLPEDGRWRCRRPWARGSYVPCPHQNNIGKILGNFHEADMDAGHGRTALLVDEFCGYGLRQIGQKYGITSAVGPLLGNGCCASQEKIVDFLRFDSGSFYQFRQQLCQQIISSHFAKPVPGRIIGPGT